jgi:hypothetical protein
VRGGPWRALTGRLALISLQPDVDGARRRRPTVTVDGMASACACVAVHTFSKSDRSEDRSSVQGFSTSIRPPIASDPSSCSPAISIISGARRSAGRSRESSLQTHV